MKNSTLSLAAVAGIAVGAIISVAPAFVAAADPPSQVAKPSASFDLQPLKHGVADLTVDLGVGLWAWPMPMDWEGDGDLDLVVSCPDVPYRGIFLFENPGGGDKLPVFKPPRLVGPGTSNIGVSYVDGKPRVLVPGYELTDFRDTEFGQRTKLYPRTNVHPNRVRANQWKYVDYDGDGALDLIVGVGDWTDYGWDNAFDRQGNWTRGPLRGFVYLIRNQGTTDEPNYAEPQRLTAGAKPIEVFGMPSPNFADFDSDGDLDLLCGEFLDGFTYFENGGTRTEPSYRPGRRLKHDGRDLDMDLQMIVPTAVDWDADGDVDLVVGDEDGRVALVEHTGRVEDGLPAFLPPKYFRQQADLVKFGALVTPVSVDWDGDGDEDLVCGNTAGYVGFIENLDGGDPPQWAEPQPLQAGDEVLRIEAGENGSIQGPAEAKWGYTTLSAADWDHDGRIDLVVNSIWGRVVWYRNVGTRTAPRLAAARDVEVQWPGKPPKPAWNWWDPAPRQLATQWRTTPVVIDLNRDGLNDLVMLDHEGYLSFFRREQRNDQLALLPGERFFTDTKGQPLRLNSRDAGKSGRRKLCFADWDGDGKLDLLVNSMNADLYRNVSTDERPWAFRFEGPVHQRRLAGHTTSPTVVDYNRDGRPDLVLGAEDGHLYYLTNNPEPPARLESKSVTVEGRHFQAAVLDNEQTAFANRTYVWIEVPEALRGWRYTKTYGGEPAFIRVTASTDTTLHLATAPGQKGMQSPGWKKVDAWSFRYTDGGRTAMQVYTREVKAGQEITLPQGNWTGSLLLIPPDGD